MIDRNPRAAGFTVAELIVAMTISAVTLLSGYELFGALKSAGDRQSEDLAVTAGIVHGLDRMREDLLHAVPRDDSEEPIFTGNNPSAESGTETSQLLRFYSLCTASGDNWARSSRQMCQVSYELARTKDSVCLYRSVVPVVGSRSASHRELILDSVEQIRIAFHDGRQSQNSFSSKDKLPAGVELTLTAHGQTWPLMVRLPCSNVEGQP